MNKLTMKSTLYDDIIAYGNSNLNDEVCGIGLGIRYPTFWECNEFIPVPNVVRDPKFEDIRKICHLSPNTDYIPHPIELNTVLNKTRLMNKNAKKDLILIFHTHPRNLPNPSMTDIRGSGYTAFYLIYSPLYKKLNTFYTTEIIKFKKSKLMILGKI